MPHASQHLPGAGQPAPSCLDPAAAASALDRLADLLLSCGRTTTAERLAFRAAELRERAQ